MIQTDHNRKLGFGLMRLPKIGEEIDLEQTKQMVDLFMKAGFTYFDTAFVYKGSEDAMRQVLVERYPRDSYTIATKNAAWMKCETAEDAVAQFRTSLARTGAGYFDYYLLHNLGNERTKKFEEFGMWDFVKEMKEAGKIRHIGFSFHSSPEELEEILTAHPEAEFVQLQINYADWENPEVQSRACYETARRFHKPVVIMEPVKGGLLAYPPETVRNVFLQADPDASFASWAIRFAASLDGVLAVLSGMSSVEQMEDNLSYMKDFRKLSEEEQAVMAKARQALNAIPLIPCTSCGYCAKVCPMNIGIPATFTAMNALKLYNNPDFAKRREARVARAGNARADACIKCGACEGVCPQHIPIRDRLEEAVEALQIG